MFLTQYAIETLQKGLIQDLLAFLPELILCGTIVLLLLLRLLTAFDRWHLGYLSLIAVFFAMWAAFGQWQGQIKAPEGPFFGGMLVYDAFTIYLRLFLTGFTLLVICLSLLTRIPDREDSADFHVLLLGATVGMSLMASANHLLMVYIAVEMASLPSYALAGFLKGRRQSSEASLKYVVYGGGASGIMLYGISLIAGKFGTGYLPDLAKIMPAVLASDAVAAPAGFDMVVLLGLLFILVGLAFKLSAVPFHFWCPDVFEGASAEVAGFLSVASKGAALALLARFVLVLAGPINPADPGALARFLIPTLAVFAAVTATFGNLAAYSQTNLKRLLAYSTIAHAGYMLMGLATLSRAGAAAVLFYLAAYLFMNLGAFAIVAFLRNLTGSEDLSSFRGLVFRAPALVITLAVFLFSLLGMPPLVGFAAKFQIFSVLFDSGREFTAHGQTGLGYTMYALLVIGGINTVVSLVYYVKVLKVMILDRPLEEVEDRPVAALAVTDGSTFFAILMAACIFAGGIAWNPVAELSDQAVAGFAKPAPAAEPLPRPVAATHEQAEALP